MAIVVGVDGSRESREALRWALAEAALRGTSVRAVRAWQLPVDFAAAVPPLVPGAYDRGEVERDEERRRRAEAELESVVAAALREAPDGGVRVRRELVAGHAAQELVRAAQGEELLVVGSRGRGGFTGLLLGSVSQACAHHADCPVVIVRG